MMPCFANTSTQTKRFNWQSVEDYHEDVFWHILGLGGASQAIVAPLHAYVKLQDALYIYLERKFDQGTDKKKI